MKVSKGQSQPETIAAAFLILYMVLGRPFYYQVLIMTHLFCFCERILRCVLLHLSRGRGACLELFGAGRPPEPGRKSGCVGDQVVFKETSWTVLGGICAFGHSFSQGTSKVGWWNDPKANAHAHVRTRKIEPRLPSTAEGLRGVLELASCSLGFE